MNRNDILRRPHLKLGLFGANVSSGRSYNMAPERWDPSWVNNVALAQMADEAGLECMIPIARWQGYGGDSNPNGEAWESITWAAGLLSVTKRINVFATVHVPLLLPVVAAKQMATVDHIGQGRFGINVVCGWNEDEFAMFGTDPLEHDERYRQGREWWAIIEGIWAGRTFDYEGEFFNLRGVQGEPVPFGGARPLMMNAGTSPAGRQFATDLADMHFDAVRTPEDDVERVAETKAVAKQKGRTLQVWTPVGVVCRPTQQEAEEFTAHIIEHADQGAVGNLAELHRRHAKDLIDNVSAFAFSGEGPVERRVLARGNFCAIGDADRVAAQIARLHRVGFDGLALNFVNYLDEFPYFVQEVLPRLEALGVRENVSSSS